MIDTTGMDQRWNTRQPLRLEIKVYDSIYGKEEILRTHTKNVSLGGMFILTAPRQLTVNHNLSIGFPIHNKQGSSHQRLSARVVRSTEQGAGLAFNDNKPDTIHLLRNMLYDQTSTY